MKHLVFKPHLVAMSRKGKAARPSATTGPVSAPLSPGIEAIVASVDSYPEPSDYPGPTLAATSPLNEDIPGPSSTFIPRQPTPALPDLRRQSSQADSDESDDEVIAQLPIYLSPSLHPHFHLLQYPLHHKPVSAPTWAKDRGKYISIRVKEQVGRVEIEIPVDGGADVWRDDRARDLGLCDGCSWTEWG